MRSLGFIIIVTQLGPIVLVVRWQRDVPRWIRNGLEHGLHRLYGETHVDTSRSVVINRWHFRVHLAHEEVAVCPFTTRWQKNQQTRESPGPLASTMYHDMEVAPDSSRLQRIQLKRHKHRFAPH